MFKFPDDSSIFSAESLAIREATTLLTNEILIISDSLSALRALENPHPQNTIISHIQEKISGTDKNIEHLWVSYHACILETNEQIKWLSKRQHLPPM